MSNEQIPAAPGRLGFTVATFPNMQLRDEIELIKVGLLYGDHVNLLSPVAGTFLMLDNLKHKRPEEQQRFLLEMALSKGDPEGIEYDLVRFVLGPRGTGEGGALSRMPPGPRKQIESGLRVAIKDAVKKIEKQYSDMGGRELDAAIKSGILTVHEFDGMAELDSDLVNQAWVRALADTLFQTRDYPLFDEDTWKLVRAGMDATEAHYREQGAEHFLAQMPPDMQQNTRRSGFAAYLCDCVPNFSKASVGEVLDIRKRLEAHLSRFRSKVFELAQKLEGDPSAKDFKRQADEIFLNEVKPSVDAICEEVEREPDLLDLKDPAKFITIAIGAVATASLASLSTSLLTVAGAAAATAAALAGEKRERLREQQKNVLYFYAAVGERLKKYSR